MRLISLVAATALLLASATGPVMANSCYSLWYARNAIYHSNGYCFRTDLARQVFGNRGCWTDYPEFTRAEQRRIDQIRREEEWRGCKVNE